jgi:oxygen-independent coproporphyrinogen-3 oxidase
MAGIYIHIPFCKKRCTYCDFYTEVAPQLIPKLIDTIVKELTIRRNYLKNATIQTIYFGGGTPSILNHDQFSRIFEVIYNLYKVTEDAEITFEANPDDLTIDFLSSLQSLPFNRISIGIQSFDDSDLKRINRRHTSKQAIEAIQNAKNSGFKNISIDLIYGLPFQTLEAWEKQLETAFSLEVQHISSYGLTYEEGTELWKQRENGTIKAIEDEILIKMYKLLIEKTKKNDFDAYEISNFAKPSFQSRHNTSYWKQESYLGIGPSAHSYILTSRQWNIASITRYIDAIEKNTMFFEQEKLTINEQYNDFVMVSLRTSEGLNIHKLEETFGSEFSSYCLQNLKKYINNKKVDINDGKLRLTPEGILISNLILIDIMKV